MAAKGVELASAYISLNVATDKIPDQVRRALGGTDKIVDDAGRRAGKRYDDSAGSAIGPGIAKALAKELRSAGDEGSKQLLKSLASGHRQAERDAAVAGKKYAAALSDSMNGGGTQAAKKWEGEFRRALSSRDAFREFDKPLNIGVDVDTRGASNQMRGLRRDIDALGALKLNLGAAGISALPAMASGLAEVAAAMQQVAQAGLAIPGGIAGVVGSVGTLAFGLTGVKDAYEAVTKAGDDAATSGGSQASQARASAAASNSLRNAVVDEAQARKDVARATRDARNELIDLNIEQRGGIISEKRAVLEAQRAREELASGSSTDMRDQLLRVEEADQRLLETRARNVQRTEELAEANSKGVASSDRVIAANERMVRSQQNVAEAQAAVADSGPKASAAQEQAMLALGKLAPQARDFVATLHGLADGPGMALRNMVQGNIFDGMSDRLANLSGRLMPSLEKGLGSISRAWNKNFTEMFGVLDSDRNVSLLDRILGNTAQAQSVMTGAIDPIVKAVGTLTAAGSDSLPRMAKALTGVSDRFANFITAADKDGRLQHWIDQGITSLGQLGESALNVGKMFTAITGAADGGFLPWLQQVTTHWQQWMNSTQGQDAIKNFLAEGKRVFEQWKPILEDIPGLFKGIYDGARQWIGAVTTVLAPITEFLKDHPRLVAVAAEAYLVFSTAKVLGSFAGLLTMFGTTLPAAANRSATAIGAAGERAGTGFAGKLQGAIRTAGFVAIGAFVAEELLKGFDKKFDTHVSDQGVPGSTQWYLRLLKDPKGTLNKSVPGPLKWTLNMLKGPANDLLGMFDQDQPKRRPSNSLPPPTTNPAPFPTPNSFLPLPGGQSTPGAGLGDLLGDPANAPGTPLGDMLARTGRGGGQGARTSGYGLAGGTNSGGYGNGGGEFPAWVHELGAAFGVKPSTYPGHQESDRQETGFAANPQHQNRGIDWSGSVENMQRFAEYLSSTGMLEQVIWSNPNTGQRVGVAGGQQVGNDYYGSDWGGHTNHVHTRQSMQIPLPPNFNGAQRFDDPSGTLSPGATLAVNDTGEPEMILNPDQLQILSQMGIDPNALLNGGIQAPLGTEDGGPAALGGLAAGTEGYIPSGAGSTGVAGTSFVASLLNLGNEAVSGLIDMGAQAAKMGVAAAATAAAGAGSMGAGAAAGAAAGPAAGVGIDILSGMGKRAASYGFQMASIGADSLIAQAFPIGGPPRWMGYDYTQLAPNLNIGATMAAAGRMVGGAQPSDPMADQALHGGGGVPGPASAPPSAASPIPAAPSSPFGTQTQSPPSAATPPPPPLSPAPPPKAPQTFPANPKEGGSALDPSFLLPGGVFDDGGVLQPNKSAINLSSRPEYVFTQSQFRAMEANAGQGVAAGGGRNAPLIGTLQVQSWDEAHREIRKTQRREAGTYANSKAGLGS